MLLLFFFERGFARHFCFVQVLDHLRQDLLCSALHESMSGSCCVFDSQVEVVEGVAGEEDHHDDQEEQGEENAEAEGQHDEHDEDGETLLLVFFLRIECKKVIYLVYRQ